MSIFEIITIVGGLVMLIGLIIAIQSGNYRIDDELTKNNKH